jgi:iron complex outermembrane receptor protein
MALFARTPRFILAPVAIATGLLASDVANAQAAADPAAVAVTTPSAGQTQNVVVTGTRRSNRTVAESESPIDILSARDLQAGGAPDLGTVLSQLLPSFNDPRPSVTDASDAVRAAQLRGLSPDETLVLIDGKRRHTTSVVNVNGSQGRGSSPVDLGSIPIAAIDHIEVLRDGAAAQYGSDAIAGVINIILKKGAQGGFAQLDGGKTSRGDGAQLTGSASAGYALDDQGWVRLSVEERKQDHTNRAGPDTRDPTEPRYGEVNQRYGDPDSRQQAFVLTAAQGLSTTTEAYAFATFAKRDTLAAATWRTAQTAVGSGVLRSPLYPDGFLPIENSSNLDLGLVAGVRGDLADWHWDVSVNHGSNKFSLDIDDTANFSLGAASPTSFHVGALENSQTLLNVDAVHDIEVGLATPLTFALGAEAREERYEVRAGDADSYSGSGAQGFSGFRAADAGVSQRHSEAAYVDLEAGFTRSLSGSLALRAEHYSDFGDATSAKAAGRWEIDPVVALRATASTGFRAPSLAQEHYTITTTNFIVVNGVNTPLETGTFAVDSAAARALGAQPLRAEKSRNFSVGALFTPVKNWQTTVDVYQIDIAHRVLFSANLVLPSSLQAALAAQGVLASAARYFTNGADTRTRGIDIVSTLREDWRAAGRTDFTLGYNRNRTTATDIAPDPAVLAANGLTLIDHQTIGRATETSPSSKLSLAADHALGAWSLRVAETRWGSFIVPQNNLALEQKYGADWLLDISGGWRHGPWSTTLGVDNVTNRYPDKTTSAGNLNTNGIFPYSNFSPFGFDGREVYAKVAYAW